MLAQGSQGAAGRAERGAARVGEGPAPDRVVLEGAGLAAGAEVRVRRRFHGRHAGVIGVQVGVIHLIHGDAPVRTPVTEGQRGGSRRVFGRLLLFRDRMNVVQVSPVSPNAGASPLRCSRQLCAGVEADDCSLFFSLNNPDVFVCGFFSSLRSLSVSLSSAPLPAPVWPACARVFSLLPLGTALRSALALRVAARCL